MTEVERILQEADLGVPCQSCDLLRQLLRKRREGELTPDTQELAEDLSLAGSGLLWTAVDSCEPVGFEDHRVWWLTEGTRLSTEKLLRTGLTGI